MSAVQSLTWFRKHLTQQTSNSNKTNTSLTKVNVFLRTRVIFAFINTCNFHISCMFYLSTNSLLFLAFHNLLDSVQYALFSLCFYVPPLSSCPMLFTPICPYILNIKVVNVMNKTLKGFSVSKDSKTDATGTRNTALKEGDLT